MWKYCLSWDENRQNIIAKLPTDRSLPHALERATLVSQLRAMEAETLFLQEQEVASFIEAANSKRQEAYQGFCLAQRLDTQILIDLTNNDMLASMTVIGRYGGNGLKGPDIIRALAKNQVIKGINKLALKKVLILGNKLAPGQRLTQVVAAGKAPVNGRDAQFIPLVEDISKRILRPQKAEQSDDRVDMRNLGQTITVEQGEPVMRREPATEGTPGYTVQGKAIPPQMGKDRALRAGKGTEIDGQNPNVLLAAKSGTPIIKEGMVDVDDALVMNEVSVATGHVSFKGNVLISGNIEPGMQVKATGSITIGGFVESAYVQAQEDIIIGKGIIGHNVGEDEQRSCVVKANGSISANYAQFSQLQAKGNINLQLHCMNNQIQCGGDLEVVDSREKHGTLSGGVALVGGKVRCVSLGVEGDTATKVHAFYRYGALRDKLQQLRESYSQAQADTMTVIRKELEWKKTPKADRDPTVQQEIDAMKADNAHRIDVLQAEIESSEMDIEQWLHVNTVQALARIHTRVTIQFGNESVITKRTSGGGTFAFNHYEIRSTAALKEEDLKL